MKRNEFAVTATVIGILLGFASAGCLWGHDVVGFLITGYAAVACFAVVVFRGAKFRRLW
jgi:type III secretory pathway component EscT